jgi:gamma-polyglutamate synthase
VAAVLRAHGLRVIAKTTGSRPCLLLPGGSEETIARRGGPTILEQKEVLARGARLGAGAAVCEIMSIHAENHRVESRRLLQPHLVIVTNFYPDHREAMGNSEEQVAAVLAGDLVSGAVVITPATGCPPRFEQTACRIGARLLPAVAGRGREWLEPDPRNQPAEEPPSFWPEQLDQVAALCDHLGIPPETVRAALPMAQPDIGELFARRIVHPPSGKHHLFVNAFAANDPRSSARVLERVRPLLAASAPAPAALLITRGDRADRTAHWLEALSGEWSRRLSVLHVAGPHARLVRRRLKEGPLPVEIVPTRDPAELTLRLGSRLADGALLVGLGNIVGLGAGLASWWSRTGEAVPLEPPAGSTLEGAGHGV